MTEINTFSLPHLFEDHLDRILAPAPETRTAFLSSELIRDMAFDPSNYYSSSTPARQPLEARSASVSSVSSASYPTPHSSHHGTLSRTLSPASVVSEPGRVAPTMTTGNSYPQHPYTPQSHTASLMPSPSQYFPAQIPPPVPFYPSLSTTLRHYTAQAAPCGYPMGSLPAHPSPLSIQSFPPLDYQSFPSSSYQSPTNTFQSYHGSPQLHQYQGRMMGRPATPKESALLKGLQKLPPHVVKMIYGYLEYLECHQIYAVCRWFRDNFHPRNQSVNDKIAGVRYAELYYRRYFPSRATSMGTDGKTREYDSKHPGSFGCYHCFRIKDPEHFELFKWNNPAGEEQDTSRAETCSKLKQESTTLSPPAPPHAMSAPESSTRNPHYDPTLTRSMMTAAAKKKEAANKKGRGSPAARTGVSPPCSSSSSTTSSSPPSSVATITATATAQPVARFLSTDSPRIQQTWGIRRFCIGCGIANRWYKPGDLIELCKPKEAVWVCKCWKIHKRPDDIKCDDCDSFIPLSTPNRRRV